MKGELDNLPTEETLTQSPEVFSPTFKNNLSRFSLSQSRREEILRYAMQEASQKLQSLQNTHRMIKGTLKEKSNILLHKIHKNREDISRLEKQLEKLEQNSANMTLAIKKQNQQKLEAFKVALKPLEDLMEMLHTCKNSLVEELAEKEEALKAFVEKEAEFLACLDQKYSEDLKYETSKKTVIDQINQMKQEHYWEYKEYIEDRETKEFLTRTREDKKLKLAALNSMDKIISDLSTQSEVLTHDIDLIKASKVSNDSLLKNESELSQLESFLNLQCRNFEGPVLSETIEELCTLGNFPVNQMIFKEQFRLIEREELDMLEFAKNQQETYESKIEELSRTIEELEVEVYALISVQQNDPNLEKQLANTKANLEKTKAEAKKFARDNCIKAQVISKWKSDNRNILLITDTERIPSDEQVVEEFKFRLSPFVNNPEQWRAMDSVINRYCEKAQERESMQNSIISQKQKEDSLIESKIETLRQVRAIKTSKESERSALHTDFQKILNTEKITIKQLESSKLEVESANKSMFKERLNSTLQTNLNYAKVQKTYGDKAIKKLIEKETSVLRSKIEQEKKQLRETFEKLYNEKISWERNQGDLKKDISNNFLNKLNEIQNEIKRIKQEKAKIETEVKILTESENEAHAKLNQLAEQKRNELVKEAKKVACSHGGGRSERIEQLYNLRTKKETEIVEFESSLIQLECGLSDKETQAEMEIVKIKARILNVQNEIDEIEKAKKQAQKLEKTISKIDITTSDFASDIDLGSDSARRSGIKEAYSPIEKPPVSPFDMNPHITEEVKDIEEDSDMPPPVRQAYSRDTFEIYEGEFSDVSSEIPCPPEPKYYFEAVEAKFKTFFETILPMLDGTIIYKLFKLKKPVSFDPLESKVCPPENCGYAVRKIKLNKQLNKIEFRGIGKNGVESSLMVDQINSIVVPQATSDIIKARNKGNDEEHTLEKSQEFNKVYRNMKAAGKVDLNSQAFVYKSKENIFFPFVIVVKSGRVELLADGIQNYKMWVNGINMLIKYKQDLERLKYKIQEVKD